MLLDAYSFDRRCAECWNKDWKEFDDFFYDNLEIADRYGFITTLEGKPIGHISWDTRNMPEYVEIVHNCIAAKYKERGYGKKQLQEAVNRIRKNKELKKIIVGTNSNLVAPRNYESCGIKGKVFWLEYTVIGAEGKKSLNNLQGIQKRAAYFKMNRMK